MGVEKLSVEVALQRIREKRKKGRGEKGEREKMRERQRKLERKMRGGEGKKMGDLCYGTREAVAWSPPTPRWLSLLLSFPDPGEDHDTKTLLREPV